MAIEFNCTGCGKRYEVSDNLAGKRGKCKQCGQMMMIPSAPAAGPPLDDIYGLDAGEAAEPLAPLPRRANANAGPEAPIKKKKKSGLFGGSKSRSKSGPSGAQATGLGVGGVAFIVMMILVRVGLRQGLNQVFHGGLSGRAAVEKFLQDDIAEMNELTAIFNAAQDEATANAAVDKAIPVVEKMTARYQAAKDKKARQTDLDAVNAQYSGQVQSASVTMQQSMFRFRTVPGGEAAMSRLVPYIDRMVDALPAEQQAQARQGLHAPGGGGGFRPPQFNPPQFNPPQTQQPQSAPPPQFAPPPPNLPAAPGFPAARGAGR